MCLILFYTDTSDEVGGNELEYAKLLSEDERAHRLIRIEYPHKFITDSFT